MTYDIMSQLQKIRATPSLSPPLSLSLSLSLSLEDTYLENHMYS